MDLIKNELLLSGTWIYDGLVENEVHIIKTNFKPGSGDYEDETSIRDDQFGTFYAIHLGGFTEDTSIVQAGYDTIEDAKGYAENVCQELKWK